MEMCIRDRAKIGGIKLVGKISIVDGVLIITIFSPKIALILGVIGILGGKLAGLF